MATLLQKIKLLKGLFSGEFAYTEPFYVTVDLTSHCNLMCLGCPYHSPYVKTAPPDHSAIANIPIHLIERLCKELKPMDTPTLTLAGTGEPLLHPDILNLISAVKTAGFHTTLLTNGTLLEKNLIQAFIDLKFDVVKVSLWATSPEQYQQNYPGTHPDNFQKVIEGMKLVTDMKADQKSIFPSIILHFPINRNNYQGIEALVGLALATGCNGLSFAPMFDVEGALASYTLSPAEEKSVRQTLIQSRKRLNSLSLNHNIDETLLRYKMGSAVWQKMHCYIPWLNAQIMVDGTVRHCCRCNLSFGNLQDHTFQEIWNGSSFRNFRRQTLASERLTSLNQYCNCAFCCYTRDNLRVHRVFKWFSPLLQHSKKKFYARRFVGRTL